MTRHTVHFAVIASGTVQGFDASAFTHGLLALLMEEPGVGNVSADDVALNVTAASVRVDVSIAATSMPAAATMVAALSAHLSADLSLGFLLRWLWRPTQQFDARRNSCWFAL